MLTLLAASAVASNPIVIDGDFNDWPPSAPSMLEAVASDTHVHLLLTLDGPPVNLQGLDRPRTLLLDWDQNPKTGNEQGHDAAIVFSPAKTPAPDTSNTTSHASQRTGP